MALTKVTNSMQDSAPVSVLDYGADPTGVSDSTTAIQNAINSGGALILFPEGVYRTSSAITVNSNQKLYGFGASITANNGDFHNCFEITDKQNVTISELKIYAANGESAFDRAVFITDSYDITVENCVIENIGNQAASPDEYGWGVFVTTTASAMPSYGVNGNFNIKVVNNRISNIKGFGSNRGDAVYLRGVDGALVSNNKLDNCRRMTIAVTDYATNIRIADNDISDCYLAGIDIEPNVIPTGTGEIVISNNVIRNYGTKPAGLTGSQYHGIDLRGDTTDRVVISGNLIINESVQGKECITMQNGPEYTIISNNILDGGGIVPIAIQTYAGGPSDYILISDNVIRGFVESAIDTASITDIVISGNLIQSTSTAIDKVIGTSGAVRFTITENNFDIADCVQCIYLQSVGSSVVSNNNIKLDSGTGILIRDSSPASSANSVVVGNLLQKIGATGNDAIQFTSLAGAVVNYIAGGNLAINFSNDLVDSSSNRITGTFV